jgi:lysophospholipase L1-like esterase
MKARIAFPYLTLLLAFSLASTVSAQTRTIDPSRFDEDIAAFEAKDSEMMPPEDAIVVTGSSSIRRWYQIEEDLAPLTVIPRGFGGSTMADLLHFADRIVLPYKPRAVVIYEGDNDTGSHGVPPTQIINELNELTAMIHSALPETRIYLIAVKPSLARTEYWDVAQETNELYKEIAAENDKISYIDIATPLLNPDGKVMDDIFVEDKLHLNEKGTQIWAETIKAALMPNEALYE